MAETQPSFIIIGATKSATTWLSHNLRAHPEIYMPTPEIHFFSRHYDRGPVWYRRQFAEAPPHTVIGEKSASYLSHPEAPARLRALLPSARLIAQLRNPVERAYSDYCMHFRRGQVTRDVARYLDPQLTPIPRLVVDGYYHRHLMTVLGTFPHGQVQVVLYEDIKTRPEAVFRDVCAHIGVARRAEPAALGARIKDKETPRVPPTMRRWLEPLKGVVQPFRQTSGFRAARALVARRIDYPPLPPEVADRLRETYRADVERLSRFLGRDLTGWLEPAPGSRQAA